MQGRELDGCGRGLEPEDMRNLARNQCIWIAPHQKAKKGHPGGVGQG